MAETATFAGKSEPYIKKQLMNNREDIRQIAFEQIGDHFNVDYKDEGIAFHSDIRELPIDMERSVQTDMLIVVACSCGRLSVELDTMAFTLRPNEVLVCLPNSIIANCMISPDFSGGVLCLSRRGILEQIPENELWDKALQLAGSPIIRADEEGLRLFNQYGSLIRAKLGMERKPYYKESIACLAKAILYELLDHVESKPVACGQRLVTQGEVMFKNFLELLSTTRVKPRNVAWYAEQLCVTSKYMSTVVKQVSGKTAGEWIHEFIAVDIRYWLKNSNKTVKEIADMLEFPNLSFFGKYCRGRFGLSPTEYRRQLRSLPAEDNPLLK